MRLRLLLPRGGGRAELRRDGLSAARDLDWDGCVNARDLGGLPTVRGGVTRRAALIRSEAVDRLSPPGWRALREYGVRTVIDLREADERGEPGDGVETIHIPLDRIADDPEFWDDWMHGPQFGTPLYYGPFLEHFPERIEQVLDAIERAPPGGVLFHCVGGRDRTGMVAIAVLAAVGVVPDAIADDYARGAERAHTHDPELEQLLGERGTSSRELVMELAAGLDHDRPALRRRLVVE
ncbi:MAG: tyrosine-protein phosphatase [Thermoleophilaceae bacterium]